MKAIEGNAPMNRLKSLAKQLKEIVEGLTYLTRKSGLKVERASSLIQMAIFNMEYRLKHHQIKLINGLTDLNDPDFSTKCIRRLVISSLINLIDNSIWWLENKGASNKMLYIGTSLGLPEGPAIVIADNGPGFIDPPECLIEPFFSRKPDGMGLGLHLVSEIMKAQGGRLVFPEVNDLSLPPDINGAIVALVFKEEE